MEFPFKYKVVKGDSLWSISRRYGVSINLICETNGIKENAILKINQILYIPGIK
ncbi:MAG: LysM peptidoglycan-binding domain-containing protein [Treponemataceae bacterium]|nr:LysM peptidoglycan-binding domain-containing protein [Treponemataceae bacterium]